MTLPPPGPSEVKIIFCDVDGTLLGTDHKIHSRTLTALKKLSSIYPEIPIVIASGKQHNSCKWIRDAIGLPDHYPSIHCNGALIYGGDNGSLVRSHGLDADTANYIIENTTRFGTFLFNEHQALLVNRGKHINDKDWCTIAGKYDKGVEDRTGENDRAKTLQSLHNGSFVTTKVTICADESDLSSSLSDLTALENASPHPFKITRAIPFIFEAIPSGINKSTAALEVCSLLSIDPSTALAFGDGENDVDLFRVVGHSVAMENGMAGAKAIATHITSSNDHGGVGEFLERIWNLEVES